MIVKNIPLVDIIQLLHDDILQIYGDINQKVITNVANTERVNSSSLDWINPIKSGKQFIAESSKAKVLFVDDSVEYSASIEEQQKTLIVVNNPKLSLMKVLGAFFKEKHISEIHSSAYIHPEAKIGENNYIGPNCFIGKCVIGDNNIIHFRSFNLCGWFGLYATTRRCAYRVSPNWWRNNRR